MILVPPVPPPVASVEAAYVWFLEGCSRVEAPFPLNYLPGVIDEDTPSPPKSQMPKHGPVRFRWKPVT